MGTYEEIAELRRKAQEQVEHYDFVLQNISKSSATTKTVSVVGTSTRRRRRRSTTPAQKGMLFHGMKDILSQHGGAMKAGDLAKALIKGGYTNSREVGNVTTFMSVCVKEHSHLFHRPQRGVYAIKATEKNGVWVASGS